MLSAVMAITILYRGKALLYRFIGLSGMIYFVVGSMVVEGAHLGSFSIHLSVITGITYLLFLKTHWREKSEGKDPVTFSSNKTGIAVEVMQGITERHIERPFFMRIL